MKMISKIFAQWLFVNFNIPKKNDFNLLIVKYFRLAPHYWELIPENSLIEWKKVNEGRGANYRPFHTNWDEFGRFNTMQATKL